MEKSSLGDDKTLIFNFFNLQYFATACNGATSKNDV